MPFSSRGMESSDAQSQRASAPRGAGNQKPRRPYTPRTSTINTVKPDVIVTTGFTWELVKAFQAHDHKYEVALDGPENRYFTALGAEHLLHCTSSGMMLTTSPLLEFAATVIDDRRDDGELDAVLNLRSVEYAQLVKLRQPPDISNRPPPGDDKTYVPEEFFENFDATDSKGVTKHYVQAPVSEGGWYAERTGPQGLRFKVKLLYNVTLDGFDKDKDGHVTTGLSYAMLISYGKRGVDNVYEVGQSPREQCIRLQVGHIDEDSDTFVPWPTNFTATGRLHATTEVVLADKISSKLFDQTKWPVDEVPDAEMHGVSDDEYALEGNFPTMSGGSRPRYTFSTVDDILCVMTVDKHSDSKEAEPIRTGNFSIRKLIQQYQFSEDGEPPLLKVLLRYTFPSAPFDGRTVYLSADDHMRAPDLRGARHLDAEMLLQHSRLKTPQDVKDAFAMLHVCFKPDSLSPEMLACYLNSLDQPPPVNVIVRWGKQPDGWFVMANCAFKGGQITSVEDSGHAVAPSFFNKNPNCPMPTSNFPRLVICPFPHVRYMLGCRMWNKLMPSFFLNNEVAAKFVFALGILGLHADDCWKGETGVSHGMPIGWAFSREQGSGKTEASLLIHSTLGLGGRPLWGGDATKSVTFEALNMESGLMKFVDDWVPSADHKDSKAMAQQVRAFYDCVARAVTGKLRVPYSGICYSSNCTTGEDDKAMQSRMITIPFAGLNVPEDHVDDPCLASEYMDARKMMSSLLPDLELLGMWNGKIDHEAIKDWAAFLQAAIGKKRDRNLNEWAKVGFIMSLLNYVFGASHAQQEAMFDWMIITVTRATHELVNHAGVLDQFVIAILQIREDMGVNLLGPNPEKVIFWHNLRTTEVPTLHTGNLHYWAVRVGQLCHVIKALTGKRFKENAVMHAVNESAHAKVDRADFYDISCNAWPIKKSIVPDSGDALGFSDVPLAEEELLASTVSRQRCVFIAKSFIDSIRASQQNGARIDTDYKQIIIGSAKGGELPYNFYQSVLAMGGWFGYRSLSQGTFRTFCGSTNQMLCSHTVPSIEREVADQGFIDVHTCMLPSTMAKWFSCVPPTAASLHAYPAAYAKMPFEFRDEDGDEEPDRDPMGETPLPSPPSFSQKKRTGGVVDLSSDEESDEEPVGAKRRRASPSNNGHRRRPDGHTHYVDKTRALYRAGFAGVGMPSRNKFVSTEAEASDDEDEKSVRESDHFSMNSTFINGVYT